MPLTKIDKTNFVLYSYARKTSSDLQDFRRELVNQACSIENCKDVILDLTTAQTISSAELSVIIRLLKSMNGTVRTLRLVTPEHIKRIICSTNINKLNNLQLYDSLQLLLNQMQSGEDS